MFDKKKIELRVSLFLRIKENSEKNSEGLDEEDIKKYGIKFAYNIL